MDMNSCEKNLFVLLVDYYGFYDSEANHIICEIRRLLYDDVDCMIDSDVFEKEVRALYSLYEDKDYTELENYIDKDLLERRKKLNERSLNTKQQIVEQILKKYFGNSEITEDTIQNLYQSEMFKADKDGRLLIAPYITYPTDKDLGTPTYSPDLLCSEKCAPGNYVFFFHDGKACACQYIIGGKECDDPDDIPDFLNCKDKAGYYSELAIRVNNKSYTIGEYGLLEYLSDYISNKKHIYAARIKDSIVFEQRGLWKSYYPYSHCDFSTVKYLLDKYINMPNSEKNEYGFEYFKNNSHGLTYDALNKEAYSVLFDFIKEDYIKEAKRDLQITENPIINHNKVHVCDFDAPKRYSVSLSTPSDEKFTRYSTGDDEYEYFSESSLFKKDFSTSKCLLKNQTESVINEVLTNKEYGYNVPLFESHAILIEMRKNLFSGSICKEIEIPCKLEKDKTYPFQKSPFYYNYAYSPENNSVCLYETSYGNIYTYPLETIKELCDAYFSKDYSKIKETLGIEKEVSVVKETEESTKEESEQEGFEPELDNDELEL